MFGRDPFPWRPSGAELSALIGSGYRSLPRMGLDLAMWGAAAELARGPWSTAAAIAFIGAVPMHDLLFHSHEGAHGHLSRSRAINDAASAAVHALFGMSATGYRGFHMAHHRRTHTEEDPEFRLMNALVRGAPGVAWLAMPIAGIVAANAWAFVHRHHAGRAAVELAGVVALHAGLFAGLGSGYLTFVLLPMATSLWAVTTIRALCEHHGKPAGQTRSTGGRLLGLLWSNANYHAEHHLAPQVPYHRLPEVRRLAAIHAESPATGLRLLAETHHFGRTS